MTGHRRDDRGEGCANGIGSLRAVCRGNSELDVASIVASHDEREEAMWLEIVRHREAKMCLLWDISRLCARGVGAGHW